MTQNSNRDKNQSETQWCVCLSISSAVPSIRDKQPLHTLQDELFHLSSAAASSLWVWKRPSRKKRQWNQKRSSVALLRLHLHWQRLVLRGNPHIRQARPDLGFLLRQRFLLWRLTGRPRRSTVLLHWSNRPPIHSKSGKVCGVCFSVTKKSAEKVRKSRHKIFATKVRKSIKSLKMHHLKAKCIKIWHQEHDNQRFWAFLQDFSTLLGLYL